MVNLIKKNNTFLVRLVGTRKPEIGKGGKNLTQNIGLLHEINVILSE